MAAEHSSPAPEPSRAIYGFVTYLLFYSLLVLYILWSFLPINFYQDQFELPNKYFALFVPVVILTATTLFAFFIYPSLNLIMSPNIDSVSTVVDNSSIKRCDQCDKKLSHNFGFVSLACDHHQKRESKIIHFCDCIDKNKCLLNMEHASKLLCNQEHIRNSADMNIWDISSEIYKNVDQYKNAE